MSGVSGGHLHCIMTYDEQACVSFDNGGGWFGGLVGVQRDGVKCAGRGVPQRYSLRLPEVSRRHLSPDRLIPGPTPLLRPLLLSVSWKACFFQPQRAHWPNHAARPEGPLTLKKYHYDLWPRIARRKSLLAGGPVRGSGMQVHYELSGLPDSVLALPLCTYACIGNGGTGTVWNASVPVVPNTTGPTSPRHTLGIQTP